MGPVENRVVVMLEDVVVGGLLAVGSTAPIPQQNRDDSDENPHKVEEE
jgi:hypothetical protein